MARMSKARRCHVPSQETIINRRDRMAGISGYVITSKGTDKKTSGDLNEQVSALMRFLYSVRAPKLRIWGSGVRITSGAPVYATSLVNRTAFTRSPCQNPEKGRGGSGNWSHSHLAAARLRVSVGARQTRPRNRFADIKVDPDLGQ